MERPEMDKDPMEICFRLCAVENMVQKIEEDLSQASSSYLDNGQKFAANLKLAARCLQLTRSCINDKFSGTRPWTLDPGDVSAEFESRISIRGRSQFTRRRNDVSAMMDEQQQDDDGDEEDVLDECIRDVIDVSDALRTINVEFYSSSSKAELESSIMEMFDTKEDVRSNIAVDSKEHVFDEQHHLQGSAEYKNVGGGGVMVDKETDTSDLNVQSVVKVECNVEAELPLDEEEEEEEEEELWYPDHSIFKEEEPKSNGHRKKKKKRKKYIQDKRERECDICGKWVTNWYKHRKIHLVQQMQGTDHTCSMCGRSFTRVTELKRHHCTPSSDRKLKLESSDVKSEGGGRVNFDSPSKDDPEEKSYICPVCGKCFHKAMNLSIHKRIHEPREKMYCKTCGRGFLTAYNLKKHMEKGDCEYVESYTTISENEVSCNTCGKVVKNNESYMRSHIKTHSDEKPCCCEVCGETFRRPWEVNIHRIRNHNQPSCDICGKVLATNSSLYKHQRAVHSNLRPYSCEICGKSYKDKSDLKKHTRVHNTEQHVKCDVCLKSFMSVPELNRHYQKVHIEAIHPPTMVGKAPAVPSGGVVGGGGHMYPKPAPPPPPTHPTHHALAAGAAAVSQMYGAAAASKAAAAAAAAAAASSGQMLGAGGYPNPWGAAKQ